MGRGFRRAPRYNALDESVRETNLRVSSSILKSAIWRHLLARLIIEQVDFREMNPGFQFTYGQMFVMVSK